MKNDKRGFTLIELMVSLAIFGIVVTAVFGFMLAGSRSYNTVTGRLNQDIQTELVLSQFESYIMDCSSCLYFKGDKLYIIDLNSDGSSYTANVFQYKADDCIYYGKGTATKNSSTGAFICVATASDLLAQNVSGFSVTPISSDGANVTSAVVTIEFLRSSQTITNKKTIALRNKPAIAKAS